MTTFSLVFALSLAVPTQQSAGADLPDLPTQVDPANRLNLNQALKEGLKSNPQITASQWAVKSAQENYNSQKAPINPTLSYAAINNTVAPLQYAQGFDQGTNYTVYVTVETNGAITYRSRQAREQFHQAQFDAQTTGLSLKLSILNAYVGLQTANRMLEVELKVYDNMRKLAELTQHRFDVGAGPQADLTRARIAEIQEKQNVITDVAAVNQARATLNTQLGRPQLAPIDTAEPLVYRPLKSAGLPDLLKQAEKKRPELGSSQANLHSLEAVPGLERSAYFPNLILGRDFGSDSAINVGLSIPIDLGGIHGAVAKAKADVKTQEAQVESVRQGIDLDVRSSYEGFTAAQKQVDTFDGGLLTMSETLLDQVRHGYELGANTIVDLITAENTYRSVESTYYAAVGNYLVAAYTLKHAIGDLPDILSLDDLTAVSPPKK